MTEINIVKELFDTENAKRLEKGEKKLSMYRVAKSLSMQPNQISVWYNGLRKPRRGNLILLQEYFDSL